MQIVNLMIMGINECPILVFKIFYGIILKYYYSFGKIIIRLFLGLVRSVDNSTRELCLAVLHFYCFSYIFVSPLLLNHTIKLK